MSAGEGNRSYVSVHIHDADDLVYAAVVTLYGEETGASNRYAVLRASGVHIYLHPRPGYHAALEDDAPAERRTDALAPPAMLEQT